MSYLSFYLVMARGYQKDNAIVQNFLQPLLQEGICSFTPSGGRHETD